MSKRLKYMSEFCTNDIIFAEFFYEKFLDTYI